jgi:hypothetical protein
VIAMTSDDLSDAPSSSGIRQRGSYGMVALGLAAMTCLAVAILAGTAAYADLVRKPTATQRSSAEAAAIADRWRTWPAGRIFPVELSYSTDLLTTETASLAGISPDTHCASAIDASIAELAARDHCQAGLRAAYLDQLQGIVYTVGLLAFPSVNLAAAFSAALPASAGRTVSLRALDLPGTATARFGADARQAATTRQDGPFVVLTIAGYADGEPGGAGQEPRPAIFAPAAQLAAEVIGPLVRPVTVDCNSRDWSC